MLVFERAWGTWGMILTAENELLGRPVPVPLRPLRIRQDPGLGLHPGHRWELRATNHFSYGAALFVVLGRSVQHLSARAGMLVLIMSQHVYWWHDVCIQRAPDQRCRYRKRSVSCMTSTRLSATARAWRNFRRRRELCVTFVPVRKSRWIQNPTFIHSFRCQSCYRSLYASSKASSPQNAIYPLSFFQCPLFSWRSSSSCLRLFPRLPFTPVLPFIFPLIVRFRKQFLRKILPNQLAFRLFTVCRIFLSSLTLCRTSFHDRSMIYSTTFQNFQGIFDLFSEVPQVSVPLCSKWPQYLFLCTRWFVVSAHSFQIAAQKSHASEFRNLSSFIRGPQCRRPSA